MPLKQSTKKLNMHRCPRKLLLALALTIQCSTALVEAQYNIVPENQYKITENLNPILIHGGGSSTLELNGKKFKNPASDGIVYIKELKCWVFGTRIKSGSYHLVFLFADGKVVEIPTKLSTTIRGWGRKPKEDAACLIVSHKKDMIRFKVNFNKDIVGDGEIPPTENYEVNLTAKTLKRL